MDRQKRLDPRGIPFLTARLAARPADAAPTMRGWTTRYDDRGPTLEENRRDRRNRAWLSGGGGAVVTVRSS